MSDPPTPPESTGAAEDVFAAFLAGRSAEGGIEFEELLREHPGIAPELEKLHADWQRVEGLLARLGVTQSLSERIESFHGPLDPGVSLALEDSHPTTSRASSARLERLALLSAPESRYTVRGEIGRGGMGSIQRVWDEDLRRPVAMKVVLGRREFLGATERAEIDPHKVVRFLEEAQITSQLEHPGVVPVHELGIDGHGRIYFTMRLVRGQNLRQIAEYVHHPELADEDGVRERWTVPGALAVLLRVTEAVAFAHSKGVIHRDLKPANIMVGRFGETYVMDWGLARVKGRKDLKNLRLREDESESRSEVRTDRLDESQTADAPLVTMDGDVVGTPAYMSPEQARGRIDEVDEQSDVYGVGAMLYHLVTGARPYLRPGERLSAHIVLNAVRLGPPTPVEELAPQTPPELVAICERAMARKKAERYPTMEAFAADLRAYLEMRVVQAYRTGAVAELKKWVARNKPLAASLAAILVVTIAGLAAIGIQQALHVEELQPHVDGRELEIVRKMSDELWPAWPENQGEIVYWLERARELTAKRESYARALAALRDRALPLTELERTRDRAAREPLRRQHEIEHYELVRLRKEERRRGADWQPTRAYRDIVASIEARLPGLEARATERRFWTFEDEEDRVAHTLLADLVAGLETAQTTIQSFEQRLETAQRLAAAAEPEAPIWSAVNDHVASDPRFAGLDLRPIPGLEPLGLNPESGLWEFAWLPSGIPPELDDAGRPLLTAESAIVLVLVPGAQTRVGCFAPGYDLETDVVRALGEPHVDPYCDGKTGSSPVRDVRLDPFFLSKYEVTQAQWLRAMERNPSFNYAGFIFDEVGEDGTWVHPVDCVDWWSAIEFARRMGLALPTSSQWEYACRAGTTDVFVGGDTPLVLADTANVIDVAWTGLWGQHPEVQMKEQNDGHINSAPVGSLAPNAFGLHDMLGNVIEWCRDWHSPETAAVLYDGDGRREHAEDRSSPVIRGGSWNLPPSSARPAAYYGAEPENNQPSNGLRVVLPVRS